MGRIPSVTSRVSARSGRTSGGVATPRVSPAAFGQGVGRGLGAMSQGLGEVADVLFDLEDKKRKEDVANAVAQADFTRRELELRNEVGPDAAGYQERTLEEYDAWVDEQAESIEDDDTRKEFKRRMQAQRPSVSSRAAQYEVGTAATHSQNQANASITALDNKIRLNPEGYDELVSQGDAVIDARTDVPASVRENMKVKWRQQSAQSRFEGMLDAATTIEDVRVVQNELQSEDGVNWKAELSSEGLERILSLADGASKAIQTKADADARAAIDYLEGRADDVTSIIPPEEIKAAQEVVAKSQNPITQARMARIVRDQDIILSTRKQTPAQQRDTINTRHNNPSLPPRVNDAITRAAKAFGVSPAYLAATAKREYGMFLVGDPDAIDYGKGNAQGASSATGIMQFLNDTWLGEVVGNPTFQAALLSEFGVDVTGMSRDELLALRKNPDIAMYGGAFWTAGNAKRAEAVLGRKPTDADLYIMHFMGPGGGTRLFRLMQSNPDMDASHLFPKAAAANPDIFNGRTVIQVYHELGRKHGTGQGSETYIEYGDRQTRQKVLDDTERRLNDDPMDFSFSNGVAHAGDVFGEGGMQQRGDQARTVADYYNIPVDKMKPFTKSEAEQISAQFQNGSADDVLGILTAIQGMGGDMAEAAMRQIGNTNDVYGFAGGMNLSTGQTSVASDIVRGQKRLEENPDIRKQIGAGEQELSDAFLNATGGALMDASPSQRAAIQKAALAHYVETNVARGGAGAFDTDKYTASVQAVLGGREGAPAVEEVNGQLTVLPPGVSGDMMERALENMTVADWVSMSEQGEPPRYIDGQIADPDDLADDATLRSIGGGRYRVMTGDGQYLITGRPDSSGRLEAYVFRPTVEALKEATAKGEDRTREAMDAARRPDESQQRRDVNAAREDGNLTFEEVQALQRKYGAQWAYDEQGNSLFGASP